MVSVRNASPPSTARPSSRAGTISIVTASSGSGHDSVARSIKEALDGSIVHRIETRIARLSEIWSAPILGALCDAWYGRIIVRYPYLWDVIYRLTDSEKFWRLSRWTLARNGCDVAEYVCPVTSRIAVSVHPICTQVMAQGLRRTSARIALMALVTELYEAHAAWVAPEVGLYVVATEEVAASLVAKGVNPGRIRVLGLPLDRRFEGTPGEPPRGETALDRRFPLIVLTGGGEGAGAMFDVVRAISDGVLPVRLVVVCGRNAQLRGRLANLDVPFEMVVLGFEENMHRVLQAADIVVGKAGAVSLAEAIALAKPTIVLPAFGGQEAGNLKFMLRHGLCASASNASQVVATLRRWIADETEMKSLRERLLARRPAWVGAGSRVARLLSEFTV